MNDDYKYMVRVSCMTYNHAPYVEDAMNGFCMQETSFPFVCTIVDDASTDGEQEMIKNYLQSHFNLEDDLVAKNEETPDYYLTIAQHNTNKNCFFAVLFLKYNHYQIKKSKLPYLTRFVDDAKYVAYCEGDDYWIVSDKLQMQVDFLEKNPDYGLCCGNIQSLKNGLLSQKYSLKSKTIQFKELIYHNSIATLTVLHRSNLNMKYMEEIEPSNKGWKMGDYPKWLWIAAVSKVFFFDKVIGVYRVLDESASHSQDYKKQLVFLESTRDIRLYFVNKYKLDDAVVLKINDIFYREKAMIVRGKDRYAYKDALKHINKKTPKEWAKYFFSTVSCFKS